MKKLIALVGIALIAGFATAADVQKIVIAKVEVKAPAKRVVAAPVQKPQHDARFANASLESFSCCSLPQ